MKDKIFVVLLAALVVFSGFQSLEIESLKNTMGTGSQEGDSGTKTPEKSSNAGGYKLPSNLGDLQTMVGGC